MSRWVWMSGFLYSSIFHVRSHYFHMHVSDGAQNEHFVTVCHQEIALAIQLHGFSLFFSTGWCIVILPSKNKIGAYFKYIHCNPISIIWYGVVPFVLLGRVIVHIWADHFPVPLWSADFSLKLVLWERVTQFEATL